MEKKEVSKINEIIIYKPDKPTADKIAGEIKKVIYKPDKPTADKIAGEIKKAERGATETELKTQLYNLFLEKEKGNPKRYKPDFSLTPEYERLKSLDTSKMSNKEISELIPEFLDIQLYGTVTEDIIQAEINKALELPIKKVIELRDKYLADIDKYEKAIDNFDISPVQAEIDILEYQYREKAKNSGVGSIKSACLQSEYLMAVDKLELEKIIKPINELKVKRYEALQFYKVYECRIELYVLKNREIIKAQIERARSAEVAESLLSLAPYVEKGVNV